MKNFFCSQKGALTIYLALIVILFFPLIKGSYSMKWDAMDLYLPWKFYVTEALKEGFLPLWNPSMNGGFPQMGDPGTWYPISWFISLLTNGYNSYSTQLEYLLHLFIGGTGMYYYTKNRVENNLIAILLGCSFMFSGVFISNAQHIGWVVAASWLPWILRSFDKSFAGNTKDTALFALFLFFQLSGGYPAFFFITCYILLFLLIKKIIDQRKHTDKLQQTIPYKQIVLFLILFMSIAGIVVYASFDMAAHTNRGGSLTTLENKWNYLVGSLTPQSFYTFFTPFATSKNNTDFWGFDFSMISVYIGAILLIITLSQIFAKQTDKQILANLLAAILFFCITLGNDLPLRKWISIFPLMDTFRFPSLFRLFGDFFLILSAGYAFKQIVREEHYKKIAFKGLLISSGLILFACIYLMTIAERWRFKEIVTVGPKHFCHTAGMVEFALFQLLLLLGLISILILVYYKFSKYFNTTLILVCILEICSATYFQRDATVSSSIPVNISSSGIDLKPEKYPIPDLKPMSQHANATYQPEFSYLWRNLPIYRKTPSHDGHSPYTLLTQQIAHAKGYDTIFYQFPILFQTTFESASTINLNHIDTSSIKISTFTPNSIVFNVINDSCELIVFNQNFYPHWKAKINNVESEILKINENYIGIPLKLGINHVELEFKPPYIRIFWYLFLGGFGTITLLLVVGLFKKEK